ncbi:MAG: hypothetical protein Q9218_002849 [Villophora microphyllina]
MHVAINDFCSNCHQRPYYSATVLPEKPRDFRDRPEHSKPAVAAPTTPSPNQSTNDEEVRPEKPVKPDPKVQQPSSILPHLKALQAFQLDDVEKRPPKLDVTPLLEKRKKAKRRSREERERKAADNELRRHRAELDGLHAAKAMIEREQQDEARLRWEGRDRQQRFQEDRDRLSQQTHTATLQHHYSNRVSFEHVAREEYEQRGDRVINDAIKQAQRSTTGTLEPGQARAGGYPIRQPRDPPSLDELIAKPTFKHQGSKNFATRQRRRAQPNGWRPSHKRQLDVEAPQRLTINQEPGINRSVVVNKGSTVNSNPKIHHIPKTQASQGDVVLNKTLGEKLADPERLTTQYKITSNEEAEAVDNDQGRQMRSISSMRWFLDSNARFEWPPEFDQRLDGHCVLPFKDPIPFSWNSRISDRRSAIDVYAADGRFRFDKTFVVKTLRLGRHDKNRRRAEREIEVLRSLRHPHCVAYLGSFVYMERWSFLLFPVAHCDLHHVMHTVSKEIQWRHKMDNSTEFAEDDFGNESSTDDEETRGIHRRSFASNDSINILRRCFVCLSQSLRYLHESKIRHGDIKPANILVDASGSVLLADFWASTRFMGSEQAEQHFKVQEFTYRYAAPEVARRQCGSRLSDIFSLGCVFLEIASLLAGNDLQSLQSHFLEGIDSAYWSNLTDIRTWVMGLQHSETVKGALKPGTLSAILSMLESNPHERPSAHTLTLCKEFKMVSLEVCRDCDPRHPDVWKPSTTIAETPTARTSEDGSSSDDVTLDVVEQLASGSLVDIPESSGSAQLDDIVDEYLITEDDEIQSLPSLSYGSSASSSSSMEEREGAVEELAVLLLKDTTLEPLYETALWKLTTDRFERNFARLLRLFATDLKVEAHSTQEAIAVRFVAARAKYVAGCIGKLLDPGRATYSQEMHDVLVESREREEKVELYLQRQIHYVNIEEVPVHGPQIVDQKDDIGPDESDSEFTDLAERPQLRNLQGVKDFILGSVALEKLRQAFHDFVIHGKVQDRGFKESEEHNPLLSLPDSSTRVDEYPLEVSDSESDMSLSTEQEKVKLSTHNRPPKSLRDLYPLLLYGWERATQFLELSEKPVPPGFKRVRWTCFCGCALYDDFREVEPGALYELQSFLNNRKGTRQMTNDQSNSHSTREDSMNLPVHHSESIQASESAPLEGSDRDDNLPPGLRRRGRRPDATHGNLASSPTWILPIFQIERYGTKVKHLPVDPTMSDETLFTSVKARYHEETSRIRRFFAMRGVKKISYVKFMHAPREPDIHKFNDWPLQKHSPPWVYKGCPAKKRHIPLIGHAYLMHLWQNPSHSDLQTYNRRPQGAISRLVCRIRLLKNYLLTSTKNDFVDLPPHHSGTNNRDSQAQRDLELTTTNGLEDQPTHMAAAADKHGNASSYVLLLTPKKLGDQLIADDEDPPEAWGLYFEEGFAVHHFFVVILFVYILATFAFAIYWCTKYGLVGPHTGAGAFGVSSWMIGLISLVVTVWFKWAD